MNFSTKTVTEIFGQPNAWRATLKTMQAFDLQQLTAGKKPSECEWLFVGCGTSYYLAQAAAATFVDLTGYPARAVPASEILLAPSQVLPANSSRPVFPVLISRSGHTSEVLRAADVLKQRNIEFLGITCDGNELAQATPRLIHLPVTEQSTVMTSSFTSMLLALQYIAASLAGNTETLASFTSLPDALETLLQKYPAELESLAKVSFDDIAVLAQGPLYGISAEVALKVMESSSTYAQYFHTLEFRHGPKSVVNKNTLVCALLSESGFAMEAPVLHEMKELGATTLAICAKANDELKKFSDVIIEVGNTASPIARLVLYVVWGQLLGSYRGLQKGLNPDEPTNLTRVVTI